MTRNIDMTAEVAITLSKHHQVVTNTSPTDRQQIANRSPADRQQITNRSPKHHPEHVFAFEYPNILLLQQKVLVSLAGCTNVFFPPFSWISSGRQTHLCICVQILNLFNIHSYIQEELIYTHATCSSSFSS